MWAGWGQRFLLVATKESLLCYFLPLAQTPFLFPWHSQSLPQWCHHRTNSRQLQPTSRSMKMPSPSSWPLACSKSCLGTSRAGTPIQGPSHGLWLLAVGPALAMKPFPDTQWAPLTSSTWPRRATSPHSTLTQVSFYTTIFWPEGIYI